MSRSRDRRFEVVDLLVRDVMNLKHPSIYFDELATKARAVLRDLSLRILPVVDEHKRLVGVVSRNDLMAISSSVSAVRVKGMMSEVRFSVTLDMDVFQAAREMLRSDEWYVPVVKSTQNKAYMGILGLDNVIQALYEKKAMGLALPLSEVMTSDGLFQCSPNDEIDNVWQLMKERAFAACPVVVKGKPVGMISQHDLLESGAIFPGFEGKKGRFKTHGTIFTLMKTPVVSLRAEDRVEDAVRVMLERNIGRVPIVDKKGLLIGIVDREDILRALMR